VVRAVTLEVTPKQAEILVKAREEGKIQLTLRNPLDKSRVEDSDMVAEVPAPKSAIRKARTTEPRPPSNGITIIRGTNIHNSESAT
jgi:pilus assembly protein CpaB